MRDLLSFGNFLKNGLVFSQKPSGLFFICCMQLLGDDIYHLLRDGFDCIIKKVIFKAGKVISFNGNEVLPTFIASCSFFGVLINDAC